MLLYNFFLLLYRSAIGLSATYNEKARLWIDGRKNWESRYKELIPQGKKRIWIHCASLGEFEQGRPLIELMRKKWPDHRILLTFFSPSGFETCKNFKGADEIVYLPMDGSANAAAFLDIAGPSLAIFIKYEFWHYFLHELKSRNIPTLLTTATFRKEQIFFRWYGKLFRKMLNCFSQIHVQDKTSVDLLESIGISDNVHITGDTRYDRVTAISASLRPIEQAEKFKGNQRVLVCGSTWPTDEVLISKSVSALPQEWKIIIAPHEIDEKHILQIESTFSGITARFSMLDADASNYQKRILIIDNIGMLSSLYAYGNIAYVGGGFQKGGIHNTLEPAIFGLPVIIGPVYRKFVEAAELVNRKAAFVANDEVDLKKLLSVLASNDEQRDNVKRDLAKFMAEKTGAADRIIAQIEASKLL